METWIDVYSSNEESEAILVRGLLEAEGIPCRLESARISQIPVNIGDLGEVRVLVHNEDFEKARKALDVARTEEEEEEI
ncbi:MAG TPA: DUF2007 domain-containing protein [Nitrospirota bacterium]|jgi:hypothetical protein